MMLHPELRRHAVSRLEVLVIVLTAILAALMLLPILQRSRFKSDRGSCLVRLKWLGTDLSVYAQDHSAAQAATKVAER